MGRPAVADLGCSVFSRKTVKTMVGNSRSAAESLRNILAADAEAGAAVGCLVELLRLPHHSVFPFKEGVIEQLTGVLDEPKFKVRKAAVGAGIVGLRLMMHFTPERARGVHSPY
jgi:hypothetical protein